MSAIVVQQATQVLAVALIFGAVVAALGALAARSMIAMCVRVGATAALAAAAAVALGYGATGLTLVLFGAGLAPVMLMGGVLLSAQAAKKRRRSWIGLAAGALVVGAIAWASPELLARLPAHLTPVQLPGLWLAVLVFVAAATCAALLGYGERGILEQRRDRFE
jgi:peptidoglycan/LPS O-acetylase OafA/YrhL